jgi:hypothetical protein
VHERGTRGALDADADDDAAEALAALHERM